MKAALISAFVFTVAEIARKLVGGEKITVFFAYSASIALIFGGVDLYLQKSLLFKYESCLTSLFSAVFFGATLFQEKSLIQEFAEKRMNGRPVTPAHVVFFKMWTAVWTLYLLIKAVAYAWIASRYTLEQGLVIRVIVGNASMYALLAVSIFGSKHLFKLLKDRGFLPLETSREA